MVTAFSTKVGVSLGDPGRPDHVAVIREPRTGETLRTKGRLYVLVEVEGRDPATRAVAQEAADTLREEYYYDRSAGIEVALRRAALSANRKIRSSLRVGETLHLACVVLCRNEAYTLRVGAAETFLLRRARLFVPGDVPGELTDYAFRAQTPPRGADHEILVAVWREQVVSGDTFILAGARTVETLGADALKSAVLTLHPSAAAKHLHDRYVAESSRGTEALLIVEVGPAVMIPRRREERVLAVESDAERIAERIRGRFDAVWRNRPRASRLFRAIVGPVARPIATLLAVVLALLPRRTPPLPRAAETAAQRARQRRRVSTLLALGLLLTSSGVLVLAYGDYQEARARGLATIALNNAQQEIAAARGAAEKKPPDISTARTRLERAERFVADAERAPRPDARQIAALRAEISSLREKLTAVVIDLAKNDANSAPSAMDYTPHGIYVADPGAGKLWKLLMDGTVTVMAQKGDQFGAPRLVATSGETLFFLDDQARLFRNDGRGWREIAIRDRQFREPVAIVVFATNLYLLDRAVGQVWKYEPTADGQFNGIALGFLNPPVGPNVVRSLGVDGDVWLTTDDGQLLRYRRASGSLTAARVEFTVRWTGETPKIARVLAKESNRSLYLLDAIGRRSLQVSRDGRESARVALPAELPEPIGQAVFEDFSLIASLHGTRLARTDVAR